ncbi:DUF4389 domain-containing protein, partial [Pseudomonas viridiflava]|uniref:DUF4389 domain-containing protein n=1 Tax=Pseudomonas viridiflava TaxID=33069 RepID=UPI001F134255
MSISFQSRASIETTSAGRRILNESNTQKNESIALRILWMLLFVIVWQVAEVVLAGVVIVQLGYRLIYGAP